MAKQRWRQNWTYRALADEAWLETLLRGECEIDIVVCGRPVFANAFHYGPRTIASHILWLVNGGTCEFRIGSARRRLEPGSLVWVMPGVEHEVYATRDMLPTDVCNLNFAVMQRDTALRVSDDVIQVEEASRFRSQAILAVHEIHAASAYREQSMRGALAVLCGNVLAAWRSPGSNRHVFSVAQRKRLVQWVQKNIRAHVSSADLAKQFGLTQDYFSRVFRRTFGMAPREWIMRERLRQGAKFLSQTRRSVTRIAATLGYQSVHLFCRQFRQVYQCTPTEYRRNQ